MDDKVFDRIQEVDLKKTMETSYIDYAMSVIVARALPDVRDGLKPVQRRILWSMIELNNGPDKPHRKCARIVGDTMGKYHPHGDSSIYGALVYMAQDWSMRYPMVDGHGNFGSVDGDSPAAMRYTEARLSKVSMEMLADINKNTVDFLPNFDETEKEPAVLPARIPNLLVNGTTGIAVGMATNMPPHNLREVVSALVRMLNDRIEGEETSVDTLMQYVKGPDFPTGARIIGRRGIEEAYRTGRGKIKVRGVCRIETKENGKSEILITELPYLVNKARLIESIAELVKNKKIEGITGLHDHSGREGMQICVEVRRDANANVVLNQLYKHTQLQDTFGVINLALVNGEPKVLGLKQLLVEYLKHQEEVVTRRTRYELNKAEERAHILEGLLIALDNIDEVIRIIRAAANVQQAKADLIEAFALSDAQAQAIVDMRLRALTGLERGKIEAEYKELKATIERLKAILSDNKVLLGVIRDELLAVADKYGDERRTAIEFDDDDISIEDMISNEPAVITATQLGYIKRMTPDNFRLQNRGGRGIKGMQTLSEDAVADVMMTKTHDELLFFTNKGRVYRLKAYQIPETSRTARGTALVNLLQLQPEEHVTTVLQMPDTTKDRYLVMATKKGIVKRTPFEAFSNVKKNGLAAITLTEDDDLIRVLYTGGGQDIFLVSAKGQCIRFAEEEIRATGRSSMGVRGFKLSDDDECVSMQLGEQGDDMLIITEKGLGKRTNKDEFANHHRGGQGNRCFTVNERTGRIMGMRMVTDDSEILAITTAGTMIRVSVADIPVHGRYASGVRVIRLDEGALLASFAKVHAESLGSGDSENAAAGEAAEAENAGEGTFEETPSQEASKGSGDGAEPQAKLDGNLDRLLEAAEADIKEQEEEAGSDTEETEE